MKQATLCFLIDKENKRILLGMKKRGFGKEKWNDFGGKVNTDESVEEATIREMHEEAGVKPLNMKKSAELTFIFPEKEEWSQTVHVFTATEWENEPAESGEMLPKWFPFSEIPYSKMWVDDAYWLPKVIEGKKVTATFEFKNDCETFEKMDLKAE